MREIKFRAWYHHIGNNDNGWMEYLNLGIDELYQRTFLLAKDFPKMTGLKTFVDITKFKHECDFQLMQYTGLKDKNGVDVFEADIVRSFFGGGENMLGHFIWSQDHLGFILTSKDVYDIAFDPRDLEVIGNLYEQPELLGK